MFTLVLGSWSKSVNKRVAPGEPLHFITDAEQSVPGNPNSSPLTLVQLPGNAIDELVKMANRTTDSNFRQADTSAMAACEAVADEVRAALFDGSGCVLVDRFPVENHDTATSRRVAGILSNLLAPLMAQGVDGTLLYDVIDNGSAESATRRRSKTNQEQPFHTDGPWLQTPPALVGLFCIQPAETGGFSQVSSLKAALKGALGNADDAAAYSKDLFWNRMGEHADHEAAFSSLPILQSNGSQVLMRHYADYVRSGHALSGETVPAEIAETLSRLDQLLVDHACEPFRLESGQFQYVNNWTVAHARAGFEDRSSQTGRHLLRLWNHPLQHSSEV